MTCPQRVCSWRKLRLRCRYGLEFVRFVLALVWYERRAEAHLRGCRVTKEFESYVVGFSKSTMKCGTPIAAQH